MKFCPKNQTNKFSNSDTCVVAEYPLEDKDIEMVVVAIKGRYPKSGRVVNKECKELAYIQEGSGKITIEGEEVKLNQGDMILIDAGEIYYWDGQLTLCVTCSPRWFPEQHVYVD